MENEPILTAQGIKALEEKLRYLETTRRSEVSKQMKKAIDHGDLSENAEYDEARNAYLQLEKEINAVAGLIARAKVVREDEVSVDSVGVGSLVLIEDADDGGGRQELRLVGPTESDPDKGKISHLCPIGTALMNAKPGEVVSVKTPGGSRRYRIVSINK